MTFDEQNKTISVKKGTLNYGETGNVILKAEFTNPNNEKAVAEQIIISVRQKPILDTLVLEKKDENQVLKNGEKRRQRRRQTAF